MICYVSVDAASTGNVDALLSEDDMEPPDDLEAVLDAILEDQPEVDAIVGDWDMLLETEGQVRAVCILRLMASR